MHGALLWRKSVDVCQLTKEEESTLEATVVAPAALYPKAVQVKCVEQVMLMKAQAWFATADELEVRNASRVVDVCSVLWA